MVRPPVREAVIAGAGYYGAAMMGIDNEPTTQAVEDSWDHRKRFGTFSFKRAMPGATDPHHFVVFRLRWSGSVAHALAVVALRRELEYGSDQLSSTWQSVAW